MTKTNLKKAIFSRVKIVLLMCGAAILVAYLSLKTTNTNENTSPQPVSYVLSFGEPNIIKNPSSQQIREGIRKALEGEEEFAILSFGDNFVQITQGALEHRFGADDFYTFRSPFLTVDIAEEIFNGFQRNPTQLNSKYEWENISAYIKSLKKSK